MPKSIKTMPRPVELAEKLSDLPGNKTVTLPCHVWADILAALDMGLDEDGMCNWHLSWHAALGLISAQLD